MSADQETQAKSPKTSEEQQPRPNRILLPGFMNYSRANSFLQQKTGKTFNECTPIIFERWRSASEYVQQTIAQADPYNPTKESDILPIHGFDDYLKEKREAVKHFPPYEVLPFDFKYVGIENLLICQYAINLDKSIGTVQKFDGKKPEFSDVLHFCLDSSEYSVPLETRWISQTLEGSGEFVTESDDLRFKGAELRDTYLGKAGKKDASAKGLTLLFSLGDPFVTVYRFSLSKQGMVAGPSPKTSFLLLANGYHRIYGLWKLGERRIPCVFADVNPEMLPGLVFNGQEVLNLVSNCARPPLFRDFFNSRLIMELNTPNSRRTVKVSWKTEFLPDFSI